MLGSGVLPLLLLFVASRELAASGLQLVPDQSADMFCGGTRSIPIHFQNVAAGETVNAHLRYRLYQSSSSTMVPLTPVTEWKPVSAGPGQTITEVLSCSLPVVRVECNFHLVWFDGEKKLGTTKVRTFPDNLLTSLSNAPPLGIVDPMGHFTNALASVSFQQLKEAEEVTAFQGRLILVAPMTTADRVSGLAEVLKRRVSSGTGVVWIQPALTSGDRPISSAYVLDHGEGHLVIAQETLVTNLSSSPLAQLHLLHLIDLALGRRKLGLPDESPVSISSHD